MRKSPETAEDRHPELILIFAAQKLEPLHRVLVLKLAMNKLKKSYAKQAKMCAVELIKLSKEVADQIEGTDDMVQKAEKILNSKEVKGENERINAIENLEDVTVDWSKLQIAPEGKYECGCCEC